MPSIRSEITTAAVCFLYARVHKLPPVDSIEQALPSPEAIEELTGILDGQQRTAEEKATIFGLIAATRQQLHAGTVTSMSADVYDHARVRVVRDLEHYGKAGHQLWPPTSQTVRKHLGTNYWNDAMRALGFPTSARGRERGASRYSDAEFGAAIEDFLAACTAERGARSFARYEEWVRAERAEGRRRPAGASVRNHFGSWTAAKHGR